MDVISQESAVICLANAGYGAAAKIDSKLGVLGNINLGVVSQFLEPVAIDPALLNPKQVQDGAHEVLVPLTEGQSASKSAVQINQALVTGPSFKSIDDDILLWDQIEGALSIEQEEEDRFLG